MVFEPTLFRGTVFALLSMFSYGVADIVASVFTKRTDVINSSLWILLLSTLLLAATGLPFFKPPTFSSYDGPLLIIASLGYMIGFLAFLRGLKVGKVSIVAPISGAWAIITAFVGVVILSELPTSLEIFGVALAISGTVLASFKLKDLLEGLDFKKLEKGIGYAIVTVLSWGVSYSIVGEESKMLGWFWAIFVVFFSSSAILFIYTLLKKTNLNFPIKISRMLFLYTILTSAAYVFYSLGANTGYVSLVGPITASSPLVVVLLARILFKDSLERNQILGIALILAGIALIAY